MGTRNGGDKTMSTYFTYKGPVNDAPAATWVIFQRVLPVAQVQANAFASLGHNSFREIAGEPGPCEVQHLIHDHIGTAWGPIQRKNIRKYKLTELSKRSICIIIVVATKISSTP